MILGTLPPRERPLYRLSPLLQDGKATVVFGAGSSGKSTLAKAIALAVATGRDVVPGWHPVQAPVLVLDWETDRDDWQEDVRSLAAGAGVPMPGSIHYRRMVGTLESQVEPLAALVYAEHIGLVIVDSVEPAAGRVREGGDVSDTTHRLHDALALLGTTSLLLDHVNAAGAEQDSTTRKPYGSIYKENRARSVFMLRGDPDSGDRLLVHTKVNRGPRMAPLGLRYEWRDDAPYRITPAPISSPALARASGKADELRLLLTREGRTMPAKEIAETLGWTTPPRCAGCCSSGATCSCEQATATWGCGCERCKRFSPVSPVATLGRFMGCPPMGGNTPDATAVPRHSVSCWPDAHR